MVLHSSTMPVPLRPEVTNKTCLKPIAAASGPACSYAPAPSSERGCLKNSFTGNSNIRVVSIDLNLSPFPTSRLERLSEKQPPDQATTPCSQCPINQPLSQKKMPRSVKIVELVGARLEKNIPTSRRPPPFPF